ncbi:hypothetical protein Tco_0780276 [Tanacetum coccineum]
MSALRRSDNEEHVNPHGFEGRAKSDILLNNLCECFNGKILDARDAPIITALEYIKEYLMRRMVNDIDVINKTDEPLTPSATKLLKVAMDKANNCRKWELTGIPCAHAITTNYNMALNGIQVALPEEWVDKCYWLATWKHAYSYTLGCLNGKVMWKKSQIPTTLTPLKHHNPVGRPRKNGRKTKEEKAQIVEEWEVSEGFNKTVTCTSTSQRSTNAIAGTRKRPFDAGTTPSTVPAKKKHGTRSLNAVPHPQCTCQKRSRATRSSNAWCPHNCICKEEMHAVQEVGK